MTSIIRLDLSVPLNYLKNSFGYKTFFWTKFGYFTAHYDGKKTTQAVSCDDPKIWKQEGKKQSNKLMHKPANWVCSRSINDELFILIKLLHKLTARMVFSHHSGLWNIYPIFSSVFIRSWGIAVSTISSIASICYESNHVTWLLALIILIEIVMNT